MRKSNFELFRLFCIFGIVVMHAMGNIDTSLSVWNTESHIFVNALFNTGVTCFILISGYFGIKFRLEKLIEMDFMVIFYTVAGVAVRGDLKAKELILACFPIITRHYWFISCYFALCFLAPLLNALAEKIKKENFERLLVTMLLLFSVIPTITTYDIMQDSGKGLVDFVMIYLIGRYLSKYPVRLQKKRLGMGAVSLVLLIFILDSVRTQINGVLYSTFSRDCSSFIIMASVCIFLWFKEFEFSSRLINRIAGNVFAVTVLDEHIQYFLKPYTGIEQFGNNKLLLLLVMGYAACVVIIAVGINEIRKATIGKTGQRCAVRLAVKYNRVLPVFVEKIKKLAGWFYRRSLKRRCSCGALSRSGSTPGNSCGKPGSMSYEKLYCPSVILTVGSVCIGLIS